MNAYRSRNYGASTEEILRVGRSFQYSDSSYRGATFDTAKLLCDEIERLDAVVKELRSGVNEGIEHSLARR